MDQFNAFVRKKRAEDKENHPPSAPTPLPPKPHKPPVTPKDWKNECQKVQRRFRHSKARQKKLEEERIKQLSAILEKFVVEGQKKSAESKATIDAQRKQIKAQKQRLRRSIRGLRVLWSEQKRNGVFAALLKKESILRKRAGLRESWQIAAVLGAKSDPHGANWGDIRYTHRPCNGPKNVEEQLKREVLQHECR
ncbi:hypothetical protein B0H13DRAFT_1911914 [Mycena leptocephala]|nr:hypothetical protein B0H13DRAFT_1911914 [Mycena leptocephala]